MKSLLAKQDSLVLKNSHPCTYFKKLINPEREADMDDEESTDPVIMKSIDFLLDSGIAVIIYSDNRYV